MRKNLVKILSATAMTAMMMGTMAVPAFAATNDSPDAGFEETFEEDDPENDLDDEAPTTPEDNEGSNGATTHVIGDGSTAITSLTVSKLLTSDDVAYAPNTSFSYTVTPDTVGGTYTDNGHVNVVYPAPSGGMTAGSAFSYSAADGLIGTGITKTSTIAISTTGMTKPGVYHYTVTETAPTEEGVSAVTSTFDVYLYVYTSEKGGLYVGHIVVVKNGEKSDASFENKYDTVDVTIKKLIDGNQADKSKEFTFTISVPVTETTSDGKTVSNAGETYKLVNGTTESTLVAGGAPAVIELGDLETVVIYGLTATDKVLVAEADYTTSDGYAKPVFAPTGVTAVAAEDDERVTDFAKLYTVGTGGEIDVTNTKNAITPTGVITTFAPYALMVAAAGALAGLFLGKKRRDEF